jgi:hypothetical protein
MRASIDDTGQVKSANSLAGFQVTRYTAKSATVQILIKQASITYLSIGYTVDWDGVDWKVRPLNTGGLYTDPALVSTLAGFVLWSEG